MNLLGLHKDVETQYTTIEILREPDANTPSSRKVYRRGGSMILIICLRVPHAPWGPHWPGIGPFLYALLRPYRATYTMVVCDR